LAAIICAEMVGYTALNQEDEEKAGAQAVTHRGLIAQADTLTNLGKPLTTPSPNPKHSGRGLP
jgi:hypothetical protein